MLKELTFTGRLSDGDPHKEYWWKQSPATRLKVANDLIIQIFKIGSWDKFPMKKELMSVRKLHQ